MGATQKETGRSFLYFEAFIVAAIKYFGETVVLDGIDLTTEKGEIVVNIGPCGTGKSTLLRCINFLEQPTGGTITVGDLTVDVKRLTKRHARFWERSV